MFSLSFQVMQRVRGKMDTIRQSIIAGTWYPGDARQLRADIREYLTRARRETISGTVAGLIVPHAGYMYSGQVAACAYKIVQGIEYDAVIVVGPSHRAYFKGASIYKGKGYGTPLGVMPVDTVLAEEIVSCSNGRVSLVPDDRSPENSIEIQIPFLQTVLGSVPFVPILMGSQDIDTCRGVADAVIKAIGTKRTLVIASSDLSHYHVYDMAVTMDSVSLEHIQKMDIEGFLSCLKTGRCEACGAGAVIVAIITAKAAGADKAVMLNYMNSGDVTGDRRGVVGYASVVFYGNGGKNIKRTKGAGDADTTG